MTAWMRIQEWLFEAYVTYQLCRGAPTLGAAAGAALACWVVWHAFGLPIVVPLQYDTDLHIV